MKRRKKALDEALGVCYNYKLVSCIKREKNKRIKKDVLLGGCGVSERKQPMSRPEQRRNSE